MNKEHEEAIDILIAGNALLDMRALVRNAPREHSLRAMLEFLEGTAEYIAKVEALIRALEPTLTAKRPDLAGHVPANANAAKLGEIFSAPRPYLAGALHEPAPLPRLLHCSNCAREQPIRSVGVPGGVTLTEALAFGWVVTPGRVNGPVDVVAVCPICRTSQKGGPQSGSHFPGQN